MGEWRSRAGQGTSEKTGDFVGGSAGRVAEEGRICVSLQEGETEQGELYWGSFATMWGRGDCREFRTGVGDVVFCFEGEIETVSSHLV